MSASISVLEKKLWDAADNLRANSNLKAAQYSIPVLGLIFLKFADNKFTFIHNKLLNDINSSNRRRTSLSPQDYHAKGVLYLPENARYSYLLNLPEGENIGKAINDAMKSIEDNNPDLKGVLPKTYLRLENDTLIALLKNFSAIPIDIEGDAFGKIYEYFLGKFAMTEGQKGGEFFTPTSVVKLIVEIIEPFKGMVLDPACGSGGMFVQSAHFVSTHKKNPVNEISIYGQEKTAETIRLAKMNLAINALSGDIKQGNTVYEDVQSTLNRFDFVMANPPFNLKNVDMNKIKDDPRYSFGIPSVDNANYLWIQLFLNALNQTGRAGFVMANSASDARYSELEIRKKIIEAKVVDVMIAVGTNFFYTVTLPCTLWFFDKGKKGTAREDKILFIDARNIYNQIDRAHREWTIEQIKKIADIVKSYRQEKNSKPYKDVKGLCKVASLEEVRKNNYSLNPGRYVGVEEREQEEYDFAERLNELNEELQELNLQARVLEDEISDNVEKILEKI